jgi:hypothetical protein
MDDAKKNLKELLKDWGRYDYKANCIAIFDNAFLNDEAFIEVCKAHGIKIQLDLFT